MEATITAKGQTTIPKAARGHLGVKAGDKVRFFLHANGSVVMLPVLPAATLRGIVKAKRAVKISEMDAAIAEGVAERYRRSGRE